MAEILEPEKKRVVAFIDGQNLFFAAKEAFGYDYFNSDPLKLVMEICKNQIKNGCTTSQVRFYTGVHERQVNPFLHETWSKRLGKFKRTGIHTFSRPLKYSEEKFQLADGTEQKLTVAREKGIDIRIALDMVSMARNNEYDVALLFTQDQDLSEAIAEVKQISKSMERWIQLACAFPSGTRNTRGVNGTNWYPFDKDCYDKCLDPNDYRPKKY